MNAIHAPSAAELDEIDDALLAFQMAAAADHWPTFEHAQDRLGDIASSYLPALLAERSALIELLRECRAYLDPGRASLTGSELRERLDAVLATGNATEGRPLKP